MKKTENRLKVLQQNPIAPPVVEAVNIDIYDARKLEENKAVTGISIHCCVA